MNLRGGIEESENGVVDQHGDSKSNSVFEREHKLIFSDPITVRIQPTFIDNITVKQPCTCQTTKLNG